ncbi:MAG: hypothetical protein GXY48_11530 [Methanomicrobiales archaeon]|nr:hypothetical protein [Methanomicrobiales archaeon]
MTGFIVKREKVRYPRKHSFDHCGRMFLDDDVLRVVVDGSGMYDNSLNGVLLFYLELERLTIMGKVNFCSSEALVHDKCQETIDDSKVLVVADFSPRNVEKLETFRKIAEKYGRELVITAKDAYLLQPIEKADGIDRLVKNSNIL